MVDFYPPRLKPVLVRLLQSIAPLVGHWEYRMRLEVSQASVDRLVALRGERLLLLPNHPTLHDWIAIFLLSGRVGEVFHYLAAYERFQGWEGKLLQWMGAYSIRRGLGDRTSVAQTLQLLTEPACHLVIFPEGGCSFQNDTVMPFRAGAVQIALKAMDRIVKQGADVPNLYVVPISMKYRYTGDMSPAIHNTLCRLERALGVAAGKNFYDRLDQVAEQVLVNFEKDYGMNADELANVSRNDRIVNIKNQVLEACEQKLGITPSSGEPLRERVYRMQHVLESREETLESDDFWTYDTIQKAAARLLNFDAIYDGYVAADPTPERFLDTLTRLEREVFSIDQPLPKGDRKVLIHVGEPVNLKDYFAEYQRDRSGTVDRLVSQLHGAVQENLDALNRSTPPSLPLLRGGVGERGI